MESISKEPRIAYTGPPDNHRRTHGDDIPGTIFSDRQTTAVSAADMTLTLINRPHRSRRSTALTRREEVPKISTTKEISMSKIYAIKAGDKIVAYSPHDNSLFIREQVNAEVAQKAGRIDNSDSFELLAEWERIDVSTSELTGAIAFACISLGKLAEL